MRMCVCMFDCVCVSLCSLKSIGQGCCCFCCCIVWIEAKQTLAFQMFYISTHSYPVKWLMSLFFKHSWPPLSQICLCTKLVLTLTSPLDRCSTGAWQSWHICRCWVFFFLIVFVSFCWVIFSYVTKTKNQPGVSSFGALSRAVLI